VRVSDKLELIAGNYVLGTLGAAARRRFEAIMERDLVARKARLRWEDRLSGFSHWCLPVRPQEQTLSRIVRRIQVEPKPKNTFRWLLLAAVIVSVAAVWLLAQSGRGP
jgi:anti-sigma-K factor RskA